MSELAQRITTSHKSAAKRAISHLKKTRNLKMSSTESLELVACVLGVANWQTLLAMAKEDRGPRIVDGKIVAPVAEPVVEKSNVKQLADYYGTSNSWGEHPGHTRDDWRYEVENDNTGLSYWEYVESEIHNRNEMFPWERDACLDLKLAKLAGLTVEYEAEEDGVTLDDWSVRDTSKGELTIPDCVSEEDAWQQASAEILHKALESLGTTLSQWDALTAIERRNEAEQVYCAALKSLPTKGTYESDLTKR
jgi:hypothetical protein